MTMNRTRILTLVVLTFALTACIAKQSGAAVSPNGPGFLDGLGTPRIPNIK